MLRFTELVQALSQVLHLTKPIIFELVLFVWAMIELGKFLVSVVSG